MFAESLLDTSWADRSRRGWTTMASFGFLAFAVAVLMALPLLYTEALPQLQVMSSLVVPAGRSEPAPVHQNSASRPSTGPASNNFIHVPSQIPRGIHPETGPESGSGEIPGPPAIGSSSIDGIPNGIPGGIGTVVLPPRPVATVAPPPRVSVMMEGNLIYKVQPTYPALARAARIQGDVVLQAIISREGVIENLHVTSGHPMLSPAAINAVRQWRYRPYMLNDEPVEVETQVTVKFTLSGN